MILVDTSVWVDHLREGNPKLATLLEAGQVLMHPFIIGELSLGSLSARQRKTILGLLHDLPQSIPATDEEALDFIDRNALAGTGIGYVDVHLLASARLSSVLLWTRDKRLHELAAKLRLAAP